jgi:hypothetical protein
VDIDGLITELQIRGFDEAKIDSALRCLVHVHAVEDFTNDDAGGVLAKDILNAYPFEVTCAASELYFERMTVYGQDVFRVKWGYDAAAKSLEKQLWQNASARWKEFVDGLDERYLGFVLPMTYEHARVLEFWKTRKDLKWFGVEVEGFGWDFLRLIDDIVAVGWALDLAFGYRSFGPGGVEGNRTLLHKKAYESLKRRAVVPSDFIITGIKLWRFFSQFEPAETVVVKLMKECGVTLEEVQRQVKAFYEMGLTSPYRDSQYPPYLVVETRRKRYQEEVRNLLSPMEIWLKRKELAPDIPPLQARDLVNSALYGRRSNP